ncbi:MAG: diguanylate cyclase, partial [Pseudomonadota bacterium]
AASPPGDTLIADTAEKVAGSDRDNHWWQKLTAWLFDDGSTASGTLSTIIAGAGEDGGDLILEWLSTRLADGSVAVLAQDNTLHHNLNQALAESRQRFRELTEMAVDFAWETDAAGFLAYVSAAGALGHAPRDLIGRPAARLLAETLNEGTSPFEAKMEIQARDIWMVRADGEMVTQTVWARPIFGTDGGWTGARGVCRDVSRSRRLEQQIARAQMRERLLSHILLSMRDELRPEKSLATAAQATAHAIAADGAVIFRHTGDGIGEPIASFAVLEFGSETNDMLARCLPDLLTVGETSSSEPVKVRHEGIEVMAAVSLFRGRSVGLLAVWRRCHGDSEICIWDVDDGHVIQSVADQLGLAHEQMTHYEKLEDLAQRDGLTGLFNRRTLLERVGRDYSASRANQMQAIAYVDIDNFKGVNDRYGHQEGDSIIRSVAEMITELTGPNDICARIGGDEFVIWLGDTDTGFINRLAQEIQQGGREIAGRYTDVSPPGLSVGIAIRDRNSDETLECMIARADRSMYEAKRGKSQVRGGRVRISSRADDL